MAENNKPAVDWIQIEVDYRAGVKPLRQIAEEHGITHGAVNKRAKRDGWTRDLKAKIQAVAEAKVSKAAVSAEVSMQRVVTEQQVVEANAEVQYRVRMEHRQDIGRARGLFRTMLEELETASDKEGQALIEQLVEVMNPATEGESEDAASRRQARMQRLLNRVLGSPERIDSGKKLVDMLEKVVRLEREAFGIDDKEGGSEVDKLLAKIHGE